MLMFTQAPTVFMLTDIPCKYGIVAKIRRPSRLVFFFAWQMQGGFLSRASATGTERGAGYPAGIR